MERLKYITVDAISNGTIIIQLTGGGVAGRFYENMPVDLVVHELRNMANNLEKSAEERRTQNQNLCDLCNIPMVPGKAIQQTVTGIPDFPGDKHPATVSPGGPGKLVDCLKCPKCGKSKT